MDIVRRVRIIRTIEVSWERQQLSTHVLSTRSRPQCTADICHVNIVTSVNVLVFAQELSAMVKSVVLLVFTAPLLVLAQPCVPERYNTNASRLGPMPTAASLARGVACLVLLQNALVRLDGKLTCVHMLTNPWRSTLRSNRC